MPKALRKKSLKVSPPDEIGSTLIYCRVCQKVKHVSNYFQATDPLDVNGVMSICKPCISEIYLKHYTFQKNLEIAIYQTCKSVNIRYDENAIASTKVQLITQEKTDDDSTVFGIYKSRLGSTDSKAGGSIAAGNLIFSESNNNYGDDNKEEAVFDESESVKEFWGEKFTVEEYRFLETELAAWKKSYSCNNRGEEFYLKQICLKILSLQTASGKTDNILKSIQQLLKDSALTPAQQTASSSGKGMDTWGSMVKTVEETTPAEYYKDKELFKDFDNIGAYIKKYITRPLKNFVTGSRDFNVSTDDDVEYDSEYVGDDIMEEAIKDEQSISEVQE
jgi:hypothetical protein